jgi:putative membrane protein insertion efficiency factor
MLIDKIITLVLIINLLSNSAYGQSENNYTDYIKFYQKFISHIRGGECQMYPSCSNYGLIAFKTYHPLKSMMMTSDRVLRCSHDVNYYPIKLQNEQFKLMDSPIEKDNLKHFYTIGKQTFPQKNDSCGLGFITHLMLEKNYREALLEINRLIYEKKSDCLELYINLIRCKKSLNEIEDVIFKYENSFPEKAKNDTKIKLEIGNCFFELGNYQKAIEFYENSVETKDSTQLQKIWMLKGLTFAHLDSLQKAKKYFENITETSPFYYNAQKAVAIIQSSNNIKYKSPTLAGFLGIIPGLGYYYSGHKASALSSLIVNGLLGYALYSNIKSRNDGMTALVGLFSFSFYLGNISGSVKSVRRYNNAQNKRILSQIRSNVHF